MSAQRKCSAAQQTAPLSASAQAAPSNSSPATSVVTLDDSSNDEADDTDDSFASAVALPPGADANAVVYPTYLVVHGFTDEEIAAAQAAGWRTLSLGEHILRIETAALAAAARYA